MKKSGTMRNVRRASSNLPRNPVRGLKSFNTFEKRTLSENANYICFSLSRLRIQASAAHCLRFRTVARFFEGIDPTGYCFNLSGRCGRRAAVMCFGRSERLRGNSMGQSTHLRGMRFGESTHSGVVFLGQSTHLGVVCCGQSTHLGVVCLSQRTHLGVVRLGQSTHLGVVCLGQSTHLEVACWAQAHTWR